MAGMTHAESTTAAPALMETATIEIALADVSGEVQETKVEREDGKAVYEIENIAAADRKEAEIKIDVETGAALKVEAENYV